MNDYAKLFNKLLREDAAPSTEVSPVASDQLGDDNIDSNAWRNANPDIVDNPDMAGRFETEGLPPRDQEQHNKLIDGWRTGIDTVSTKLEEIYKYAADASDKPGTSEIYRTIGSLVESVLADLGTLGGHLRTLSNKIEVGLKKDNERSRRQR